MKALGLVLALFLASAPAFAADPWKGESSPAEVTLGAMVGAGIFNNLGGFAIMGNAAKKIVDRGFAPEINNQVFVEAEAGPVLHSGLNAFMYSFHLRWDFEMDQTLKPYVLAGLGGFVFSGPGDLPVHVRTGVGLFWSASPIITLRGELSHELMTAGISFAF